MSQSTIRFAVIAAAGSATRMWPGSKVFPKELFPLGRVPAIVHLLWEFEEVGVERVVLVTSPRSEPALRALLSPEPPPPAKVAALPEVARFQRSLQHLRIDFVQQHGPYGNGTPLLDALPLLGGEPCFYAFGDDIVIGENASAGLLELHRLTGAPAVAAQEVPDERVSSFGIAEWEPEERGGRLLRRVRRFVEKPQPHETPSRLAGLGRYLVTPALAEQLRRTEVGRDGELWFADAIAAHIRAGGAYYAHALERGRWYTVGDPRSYAAAVAAAVALQS